MYRDSASSTGVGRRSWPWSYTWVLPAYMIRPHLLLWEAEEVACPVSNEGVTRWLLTRAMNFLPDHLRVSVFLWEFSLRGGCSSAPLRTP